MVVASVLDGRIRVRDEGLKKEPLLSRVREALLETPGVAAVEVNPRVGSLLVLFDAALAAAQRLLQVVSDLLGQPLPAEEPAAAAQGTPGRFFARKVSFALSPALKKRVINIGMLASLLLSVAAAVFHFKKLHVLTGIVFLALFGDHYYQRRSLMFS